MTVDGQWLLMAPLAPVLTALLLLGHPPLRRLALTLAPWAALPALVIALLPLAFSPSYLPAVLLNTQVGLDDTGRMFLLLSAWVWWVGGLHAARTIAQPERLGFFIFFLLAMAGNLGATIANGVVEFYCCFALMSFAAYGLVIHDRHPQALRAGRIYMMFVVAGEVALLSALMLMVHSAQGDGFESMRAAVAQAEQRDLITLLVIVGLGIKLGLPGLHVSLPLIYRAAPVPAAAVLAGAMINVGLLGWLRLLPLGQIALESWGAALMVLGLVAAFYGVAVGLTQRDAKSLLAYSSMSQMGVITTAVGLGLSAPQGWPQILVAITLYAVHHGLAKAALFLGLGVARSCPDARHWRWLVSAGLFLPALALAGAPLTSGMLAKTLLKAQTGLAPAPWVDVLGWLLPLTALATMVLVVRFLYLAWPCPGGAETNTVPRNLLSWGGLLAASLLLVWFLSPPMRVAWLSFSPWWASLWPVLTGAAMAAIISKIVHRYKISVPEIPAGDLIVLFEAVIRILSKAVGWLTVKQLPRWLVQMMNFGTTRVPRVHWQAQLDAVEAGLVRWPVAVTLFLLVVLVLMFWLG